MKLNHYQVHITLKGHQVKGQGRQRWPQKSCELSCSWTTERTSTKLST